MATKIALVFVQNGVDDAVFQRHNYSHFLLRRNYSQEAQNFPLEVKKYWIFSDGMKVLVHYKQPCQPNLSVEGNEGEQ